MFDFTLVVGEAGEGRQVTIRALSRDEAWTRLQRTRVFQDAGVLDSMAVFVERAHEPPPTKAAL